MAGHPGSIRKRKTVRFPILMQAKTEIERRLGGEPLHMRHNFLALGLEIMPVQIESIAVLAPL